MYFPGRHEPKYVTVDFRTDKGPEYEDRKPIVRGVWEDTDFTPEVAMAGMEKFTLEPWEWKRPTELIDDPVLFTDGATRCDIGQGAVGNCWYHAMVATFADHPKLLEKVVKEGDYDRETGVFHCRFWNFGLWENIYIDDHLPVKRNTTQIWGVKSADPREMWVSLLEKAFAKFHGSYAATDGGFPTESHLALTGGVAERVDNRGDYSEPEKLFRRIRNAVQTGALVTCAVPPQFSGVYNLIGGHAYTLTGAETVKYYDLRSEHLLRIRNPHGKGGLEWSGRWSDGSSEWKIIPTGSVRNANAEEGEFWISLGDFLKYFISTTIGSNLPDFDEDGRQDSLDNVLRIFGQWSGETAAGHRERLKNPRFSFNVPVTGRSRDGTVPIVIQLIQKSENNKTDIAIIRCDLYKVLGSHKTSHPKYALELMGRTEEFNDHRWELQRTFRHRVEPGEYVVVPSTWNEKVEKEFLIRIFSPCPLTDCEEIPRSAVFMTSLQHTSLKLHGHSITRCETHFGAWVAGQNAGGKLLYGTSHQENPQYSFTVPGRDIQVPVDFQLMQSNEGYRQEIGLRVYPRLKELPVDINYLRKHYSTSPEPVEGNTFSYKWALDVKYLLTPGHYMVIVHMGIPTTEKEFALHVRSSENLDIRGYQTGEK